MQMCPDVTCQRKLRKRTPGREARKGCPAEESQVPGPEKTADPLTPGFLDSVSQSCGGSHTDLEQPRSPGFLPSAPKSKENTWGWQRGLSENSPPHARRPLRPSSPGSYKDLPAMASQLQGSPSLKSPGPQSSPSHPSPAMSVISKCSQPGHALPQPGGWWPTSL